jgi:RNA polymerase sigma-70 factor (ECF subfamily)
MIEPLLLRNLSWIRGIARTFCRNRDDAEDLAGDTILKVLLNADKYDADKSFRLWVLVIMRNTYRSGMRNIGVVEAFGNLPDCSFCDDPSANTITSEYMSIIEKCAKSSVSVRCALLYAQGYSYNEIADMQDVSVNIVKSRVHHGRKLIYSSLSG